MKFPHITHNFVYSNYLAIPPPPKWISVFTHFKSPHKEEGKQESFLATEGKMQSNEFKLQQSRFNLISQKYSKW